MQETLHYCSTLCSMLLRCASDSVLLSTQYSSRMLESTRASTWMIHCMADDTARSLYSLCHICGTSFPETPTHMTTQQTPWRRAQKTEAQATALCFRQNHRANTAMQ